MCYRSLPTYLTVPEGGSEGGGVIVADQYLPDAQVATPPWSTSQGAER